MLSPCFSSWQVSPVTQVLCVGVASHFVSDIFATVSFSAEFFQTCCHDCSKPQSNRTEGAWVSFSSEIIQQKALLKVDLLSNKSSFMTQRLEGIQRRAAETILGLKVELEGICCKRKRYWHLLREKIEHVMCCTGWEGGCFQCFQETSNEHKTLQIK